LQDYFFWSFAHVIASVVTTTSFILSSSKIQNGDILVLANPGPHGKSLLKRRNIYQPKKSNNTVIITLLLFLFHITYLTSSKIIARYYRNSLNQNNGKFHQKSEFNHLLNYWYCQTLKYPLLCAEIPFQNNKKMKIDNYTHSYNILRKMFHINIT